MKLNSLELLGFKSFHNRTIFRFSDGVTALVGPNGCGKSNIVDAIVWVLGERGTKSLRVKEMGDVIFHGSNGKKPVNLAEATLTLNDGTTDISIKRRIYRDGINEYFINGEMVRLKDVQELTLGTGIGVNSYAIVEQGNIEYLAQMKPAERKAVIEETSGITRFYEKKREALGRLEEVKTNLDRVEDIRVEVYRNLERASKEREVLLVYDRLQARLKEIDIDLLSDAYGKMSKKIERLLGKRTEFEREGEAKAQQVLELKEQKAARESEISLTEQMAKELEEKVRAQEKVMENSLVELNFLEEETRRLEKGASELAQTLAGGERTADRLRMEIEAIRTRTSAEKKTHVELSAEKDRIASTRETTREMIGRLDKRVEEEREVLFMIAGNLRDAGNRLAEMERIDREQRNRELRRSAEEGRLNDRLLGLREKARLSEDRLQTAKAQGQDVEKEAKALADLRADAVEELAEIGRLVEGLRGEKRIKEEVWRSLRGKGTRKTDVLSLKQLIDIIRAPKEAEAGIERLLSREMEYHVLDEKDRHKIADIIAKKQSNFVFFPRNGIFNRRGEFAEISVTCADSIDEVFQRIEHGEEGLFIANGICIDSRGFILTRNEGEQAGIREARQRARLEKEITELGMELDKQTVTISEREEALRKIVLRERGARERVQATRKMAADGEREITVLQTEIASNEERLNQLVVDSEFADESIPAAARDTLAGRKAEYEARKEETEKEMGLLKAELKKLKETYEQILSAEREHLLSLERKRNLIVSLEQEADQKKTHIERLAFDKQSWEQKAAEIEKALVRKRWKIASLKQSHDEAKNVAEAVTVRLKRVEMRLGDLRLEISGLARMIDELKEEQKRTDIKREAVERDYAVLEERRQMVVGRLQSEFDLKEAKGLTITDEQRLEHERREILQELPALGEINFRSEKEYLELKERIEFLEKQKADLEGAVDSLKKTITKIDAFSKELFMETFAKVNDAFQRFAPMLFKGGKGMLALDGEGQGVELYVQPPGKKVVRMELLSGGEKALVSLTLLLSLMDTKPSPFTLMDEIDAPLDDANLASLLRIITEISKMTQVVLITHNRITMESSNTIYGITMEEDGISKTVAIKLA